MVVKVSMSLVDGQLKAWYVKEIKIAPRYWKLDSSGQEDPQNGLGAKIAVATVSPRSPKGEMVSKRSEEDIRSVPCV